MSNGALGILAGGLSLAGLALCWKLRMAWVIKRDEQPIGYWTYMVILAALTIGLFGIGISEFVSGR